MNDNAAALALLANAFGAQVVAAGCSVAWMHRALTASTAHVVGVHTCVANSALVSETHPGYVSPPRHGGVICVL